MRPTIEGHFTYNDQLPKDPDTELTEAEARFCQCFAANPLTMGNRSESIVASDFSPTLTVFNSSDDERIAVANRLLRRPHIKKELTRIAEERKNTKVFDDLLIRVKLMELALKMEDRGDFRGAASVLKQMADMVSRADEDGESSAAQMAREASRRRREAQGQVLKFSKGIGKAE